MKSFFILIYLCLMLQVALAGQELTHKCADFVAISVDEKLFRLAFDMHGISHRALKGNSDKLDPDHFYPIWKDELFKAYGQQLPRALVVVCWFDDKKRCGVFYFEGYSHMEARELIKKFHFDFAHGHALDGVLMDDGIISWETLNVAFPRLPEAFLQSQK